MNHGPSVRIAFALVVALVGAASSACENKDKAPEKATAAAQVAQPAPAVRADVPNLPPPPIVRASPPAADVAPPRLHEGPTPGAASADALLEAIVDAAKKRDENALLALTVSGKDIALHFHPGVQTALRTSVGRLTRKFATYTQEIPADAALTDRKLGLAVDFQKGQGAITPMPGHLSSQITLKVGPNARTLPIGRIVQIGGKWKLLDF